MFERFTDRARRVLAYAQDEAREPITTSSAPNTSFWVWRVKATGSPQSHWTH